VRVAVTGATGLIGRAVVAALRERGDEVTALSRDADRGREALGPRPPAVVEWPRPTEEPPPAIAVDGADAVVNLIGETVAQRWTRSAKRAIRDSRVLATGRLVAAFAAAESPPRVLVSQSASGWYGPRGDEPLDESEPPGDDFLAGVVREWERAAETAVDLGTRVVRTRTGVVLARGGGALEKMLPPFKLGVGGPVAGGRQYVPWVHLDDVVGALLLALDDDSLFGAVNVTAPEPVTNRELSKALGRVLGRPAVAPVPALAVKLLYGEMATIVTTGHNAIPKRLREAGYEWRRPELEPALRAIVT
jgi:uncharacterized protein (TIGR01777 family)